MKKIILAYTRRILSHELVNGSAFLFIGSTIGNFLAFLFNLVLVRHISYAQYGEFAAIVSIITLLTIPSQSFQTVVVQYATKYFTKKDTNSLASFYHQSFRLFLVLGIGVGILFLLASGIIGSFFHIRDFWILFCTALAISAIYISIVNASFLQGLLLFSFLAFTTVLGGVVKLSVGTGLVILGWGVAGPVFALFLSYSIPFLIMFFPLQKIIFHKEKNIEIPVKEITLYAVPTMVSIFALSAFTSTDVLLVKHFFPTTTAGLYSGMSLIGRIIFYFTSPIAAVMFPLVIKRFQQKEGFRGLLYMAMTLVMFPSLAITLFYFIFPKMAIAFFLGGKGYYVMAPYIGWYGIFLCVFSVLNVLVNFFLSLQKTKVVYFLGLGAFCQALLIYFFHTSFAEIIAESISVSLVLLILLLLYYIKEYGAIKK